MLNYIKQNTGRIKHLPEKFVKGYIEPLPCRCPVGNMYTIISDGRDSLQLELPAAEADYHGHLLGQKTCNLKWLCSSWGLTNHVTAGPIRGPFLEGDCPCILTVQYIWEGGRHSRDEAASDGPKWDAKVAGLLTALISPQHHQWSWSVCAHLVKRVALRPLSSIHAWPKITKGTLVLKRVSSFWIGPSVT